MFLFCRFFGYDGPALTTANPVFIHFDNTIHHKGLRPDSFRLQRGCDDRDTTLFCSWIPRVLLI